MKKFSLALLFALASSSAFAEEISVRAKVIGSESQLSADSKNISSTDNAADDDDKSNSAFGFGADVEFALNPQFRLGTGLAFTDYEQDKDKVGYDDFTWSGYGTVDFLQQDLLALYGTAGISYHNLTLEDVKAGAVTVKYDSTGLLNYDLALGARVKLQDNVHFGLEYKYTDTFSANDVKGKVEGLGLAGDNQTMLEDVTVRKNELMASMSYGF